MKTSLMLLFVWLVVANVSGMLPSKDNHWRRAYVLLALFVPLIVYVFYENPWWVGLLAIVAAASVFRWPVIYFMRWVRRGLKSE
ncbi:DUF2484 family protein [Rhodalgimonas zhirmunskyi]|uniref:DUF2484 family protein n=1 Tax=Rhodalgimonas zhirmunskyi TaxID=2964767 RepID=A0AAJ1UBJ3_9RHOB|nr:DUF2484 family protein [Rhodoalgimonas zhirmunskyi]MDQ2095460.1 DUF2484 family protein [Rhodoalgimonas zhirmunskyi]